MHWNIGIGVSEWVSECDKKIRAFFVDAHKYILAIAMNQSKTNKTKNSNYPNDLYVKPDRIDRVAHFYIFVRKSQVYTDSKRSTLKTSICSNCKNIFNKN